MNIKPLHALKTTGFQGMNRLSLADSIIEHDFAYMLGDEYITFIYAVDRKHGTGFSFGLIDSDETWQEEFFWVTEEQWHKIAEHREIAYEVLMGMDLWGLTFYVYEYFGAEAIFGTPAERFIISLSPEEV